MMSNNKFISTLKGIIYSIGAFLFIAICVCVPGYIAYVMFNRWGAVFSILIAYCCFRSSKWRQYIPFIKYIRIIILTIVSIYVFGLITIGYLDPQLHRYVYIIQHETAGGQYYEDIEPPDNYTGIWRQWYGLNEGGGNIKTAITYKKGVLHGLASVYREDGTIIAEKQFWNGKLHGLLRYYYPNGKPIWEAVIKDDKLNGWRTVWDENGNVIVDGFYINDKEYTGSFHKYLFPIKGSFLFFSNPRDPLPNFSNKFVESEYFGPFEEDTIRYFEKGVEVSPESYKEKRQ